jgi:Raf kinase inhibitor-like YbhB/YbcL family protein
MTFQLTSSAFGYGERIPSQYTCKGRNISPPLEWNDPPHGTESFVLIMDDPDAPRGTWVHWVLLNLSATMRDLSERARLPADSQEGWNSWGRPGYGGPCPPSGTHHYFFKLYALDTRLKLPPYPTKAQLLQAMEGHILAQTELMGTYAS